MPKAQWTIVSLGSQVIQIYCLSRYVQGAAPVVLELNYT